MLCSQGDDGSQTDDTISETGEEHKEIIPHPVFHVHLIVSPTASREKPNQA